MRQSLNKFVFSGIYLSLLGDKTLNQSVLYAIVIKRKLGKLLEGGIRYGL